MPQVTTRRGVVALTACVVLTACSSSEQGATTIREPPPTEAVRAYGVTIEIPRHWDARIEWPSPAYARTVHLASFLLPRKIDGRGHLAERRMRPGDIYINIGIDPAARVPAFRPALAIRRSDLHSQWEGKVPEAGVRATRHAFVDGGFMQLWVTFGSVPTSAILASVNRILRTLVVEPSVP